MKPLQFAAAVMMTIAVSTRVSEAGVTIQIGDPGYYGAIVPGDYPQPQVIYPHPVIIEQMPAGGVRPPVYLRVPPGHAKKWSKHCGRYNACGEPVYFVQDRWYTQDYAPRYREDHGKGGKGHGKGKGKGKGHD